MAPDRHASCPPGAAGRPLLRRRGTRDDEQDEAAGHDPPQGGRVMMSAHVIALGLGAGLNKSVQAWFQQFNYLPPLPLTSVRVDTIDKDPTLEHLLALVAASPHQRLILMAHGHEDGSGLFLKMTAGSPMQAEHRFIGRLIELAEGQAFNDYDKKHLGLDKAGLGRILALMKKVRDKKIDCIKFRAVNLRAKHLRLARC